MNTSSWSFPNMINIAQNTVGVAKDTNSIHTRVSTLLRTEPTELHMNPEFGVGLKKFMWQYATPETRALVKQKIIEQIARYEPCVDPKSIEFIEDDVDSMQVTNVQSVNALHLTVVMQTRYGDTVNITI